MIQREILLLRLQSGTLFGCFSFFALALFCFALALGPEPKILQQSAPPLLWLLALLTTLFSTAPLLKREYQAGLLDEVALHPTSLAYYLLTKVVAQILMVGLPLIGIGILLSPLYALSSEQTGMLSLTLLVAFPAFSALGILGGLLTLQARGGGLLLTLLILPLALPLLLLGLSVMEMTRLGLDSFPSFCLLISVSLVLSILSLWAGRWAFLFAVES